MKLKYIIPSVAIAAAGLGFSGCTDDFEEINTNPHKVYALSSTMCLPEPCSVPPTTGPR